MGGFYLFVFMTEPNLPTVGLFYIFANIFLNYLEKIYTTQYGFKECRGIQGMKTEHNIRLTSSE
ncbi:hypothetical protein, partial [Ammoniphilus sp. 3BR4]|uniref:hypothetical protein n=1 Tax=Ammoniphilus sp. 3BR4 TaxID=3158265 RepID=UPI0034673AC0